MAQVLELWTVQMGKASRARAMGIIVEDTTVKSGNKAFAPSWAIVMAHKNDGDDEAYTSMYHRMMQKSYRENPQEWNRVLQSGKVALACYCRADTFCHRLLLQEYFHKLGAKLGIEVRLMGEFR